MRKFPGLELLIVICAGILVYILAHPQYDSVQENRRRYKLITNMYTLKAAVENYAAYNNGAFPTKPSQIKKFVSLIGQEIENPYTGKPLTFPVFLYSGDTLSRGDVFVRCDSLKENDSLFVRYDTLREGYVLREGESCLTNADIKFFKYDFRDEAKETAKTSKNGGVRGAPGTLGYGYFVAPGDTIASAYGILGFDKNGEPIHEKNPAGVIELRVLHN
jgi:hypothetical protein